MATSKKEVEVKKQENATEATKPEIDSKEKEFNDLFRTAVDRRKTASFWDGGDILDRIELQNEYLLPKQELGDQSEGFRSKVKSPEIIARNQSTMQKLAKLNIGFSVRPIRKSAKLAAQIDQEILNYYFKTMDFRTTLNNAMQEALNHGTAPIGVEWFKQVRKVHMPVTNADEMTDEQKKMVKEGKVPTVEVDLVTRGPLLINYGLKSVYFDPSAITVQGKYKYCDYVFVAEMIPYETFKAEFEGKKGFENIDKVKPITAHTLSTEGAGEDPYRFMSDPIDGEGEYVFLVRGWRYSKDWYMVRANDVFIKKDYLPYIDKMIPLDILKPYSFPNQLYGISPVDLLIPTVYQIELMMNTFFDYVIYTTNPVLLVDKMDYGDFSRKYEVVNGKPGSLLPVSSVTGSVAPLKFPQMSQDIYAGLDRLQRDAVIATQHDPSQLGFMKKDATATANVMNKEVVDNYIGHINANFKPNLENVARMVLSRVHQFMKRGDVEKIINGEGQKTPFEIPIVGKNLEIDWDTRAVKIENNPNAVTVIKVSEDIYKYEDPETGESIEVTPNDYDVQLDAESVEVISKALEQQKYMEAFGQLMQYAVNPANPEMALQHPMGLVNGAVLLQEYVEKLNLNKDLLINPTEDQEKDLQRAEEQNMAMFSGERVMPKAGESQIHIQHHVQFQKHLANVLEDLKADIRNSIESGMPLTPDVQQQFDRIKLALSTISEHIDFDTTPVLAEPQIVSQMGKSLSEPPMPQPGIGQSVTQSGLGGSQKAPNVPKAAGMTQGGPGEMGGPGGM